jgi:hypothetical protein
MANVMARRKANAARDFRGAQERVAKEYCTKFIHITYGSEVIPTIERLLSLDPQLICYSWISGISEVALVVFVRKHALEIQYLRTSISEEQRREFSRLVETTIN